MRGGAQPGAREVQQAAAGRRGKASHPESLGGGVQDALVGLVQQQPVHCLDVHLGVLQCRRHHLQPGGKQLTPQWPKDTPAQNGRPAIRGNNYSPRCSHAPPAFALQAML